ncbi:hypothetical protein HRD49_31165 [Corallococcus exiguus]|uniref:hypothetical protein n=1 Tax=Corallococcus exiguus TaxID=83462 RepID=UPI001560BC28|nr:hypothetical protein [Corallococcus exiguus]NRD66226.1 hypothetical protein [Corallococcus exiguus]
MAAQLNALMEAVDVCAAIAKVHKLGGKSQDIQEILRPDLEALGFQSEKAGLFSQLKVSGLRPDFYRRLGRTGIIAEVERGKTIHNNMDLLDLWKCHICAEADFLFLIVPEARHSEDGKSIKAYEKARDRLATFFKPANYVNVDAVFLFGY